MCSYNIYNSKLNLNFEILKKIQSGMNIKQKLNDNKHDLLTTTRLRNKTKYTGTMSWENWSNCRYPKKDTIVWCNSKGVFSLFIRSNFCTPPNYCTIFRHPYGASHLMNWGVTFAQFS